MTERPDLLLYPPEHTQQWHSDLPLESRSRARVAGLRGTLVFIRQSDPMQVVHNVGSSEMQREEGLAQVVSLGIPSSVVTLVEALGEQASEPSALGDRQQFDRIHQLMNARQLGLVIALKAHRLWRNVDDALRNIKLARIRGVLFLIGTQLLDPAVPEDFAALIIGSAEAERDIRIWSSYRSRAKLSLAKKCAYRTQVPTGLIWVDPGNQEYAHHLRLAGYGDWLLGIERHVAASKDGDYTYRVLPLPVAEVLKTIELRFAWLDETHSLPAVLKRIREGYGDWPKNRVGRVPALNAVVWTPMLHDKVRWPTVTTERLRRWLSSAALYGIYEYYGESQVHPSLAHERTEQKRSVHVGRARARTRPALPTAVELIHHATSEDSPCA